MLLNEEIKEGTISEVNDQEITVKWDAEYGSSRPGSADASRRTDRRTPPDGQIEGHVRWALLNP